MTVILIVLPRCAYDHAGYEGYRLCPVAGYEDRISCAAPTTCTPVRACILVHLVRAHRKRCSALARVDLSLPSG